MSGSRDAEFLALAKKFVEDGKKILDASQPPGPGQESADKTTIVRGEGIIRDATRTEWRINQQGQVVRDGTADSRTANVVAMHYISKTVWQTNEEGGWWKSDNNGWVSGSNPTTSSSGPVTKGFWTRIMVNDTPVHVLYPHNHDPKSPTPLLLFLHQLSNEGQIPAQCDPWFNSIEFRTRYRCIVLAPQAMGSNNTNNWGGVSDNDDSHHGRNALLAIGKVAETNRIDLDRVYLTGNSMGGIGSWHLALTVPTQWAGVLIVAGATYNHTEQEAVDKLKNLPIFAVHGQNDTSVPLDWDRKMFARLAPPNGKMRYAELQGQGHGIWDGVYTNDTYLSWLFSNRRGTGTVDPQVPTPATGRGLPIPSGPLHTSGNQIVDQTGTAIRLASLGVQQLTEAVSGDMKLLRDLGWNSVRISWVNATFASRWNVWDRIVQAAQQNNMKVIFCCHTNEVGRGPQDNWGAQQKNGLWYDVGGASDGTDGGGNRGTVSQQKFVDDWKLVASRYRDAPSVIGYDLRNEPLGYPGMCSWGDGDRNHDLRRMYEEVGNAILAIDPRPLIICEGPQNYTEKCPWGDLRKAKQHPVRLSVPDKVVYSVHDYPGYVMGYNPTGGQTKVDQMNTCWGYLVKENLAPVWIGEMGGNFTNITGNEDVRNTEEWAKTLLDYMNGKANNGPRFSAGQQGIGGCWWNYGDLGNQQLSGILSGKNPRPEQQKWWSQMLFNR